MQTIVLDGRQRKNRVPTSEILTQRKHYLPTIILED